MLGDTAVAVHPEDERYTKLIGRNVRLPLVGRLIPIVADEYSDPEKGTGAVKITPAHDFNDFEVGKRHGLRLVNVLDAEARVTLRENEEFFEGFAASGELDATVEALDGLDRFKARARVVAMMDERGLLAEIADNIHSVPHGDRSHAVLEPRLTDAMVCRRQDAGPAGAGRRARRPHQFRAEELGEDLFRMAGEYSALVYFAATVVGPSDTGVVRRGWQCLRRGKRSSKPSKRRVKNTSAM